MTRVKMFVPVPEVDLPIGLAASLRVAQRNGQKYVVCEQKIVEIPDSGHAEAAHLRARIKVLEAQLSVRGENGTR